MATIRWKRANTYVTSNGTIVVDLAQNKVWVYDAANASISAAFTEQSSKVTITGIQVPDSANSATGGVSISVE